MDKDQDTILGTNYGEYDSKGHCYWFGYGKVNAAGTVGGQGTIELVDTHKTY